MRFFLGSRRLAVGAAALTFAVCTPFVQAMDMPAIGSPAPNFTLPSQDASPVSLANYKGKWVVLYFYPKDQTAGCSVEAHNFQRDLPQYQALNAVVLGVSMDSVDSHRQWCAKDSLTFKMLADPDGKAIDAYGVPVHKVEQNGVNMKFASRETFLISPDGKIAKVWDVKNIANHSSDVLASLKSLK